MTARTLVSPAAVVLTALFLSSCGDDSGPLGSTGQISVSLSFANDAFAVVDVASARVLATRAADGSTAADTVVAFPANTAADDLTVQLTVQVSGGGERFDVSVTLRNTAGETVFESGTVQVNVSEGSTGSSVLPMTYVGSGANASSIEITATDTLADAGSTLELTAVVRATGGRAITNAPIRWTSSDTTIADFPDPASGSLAITSETGQVTITAQLVTGPSATLRLTVLAQGEASILLAIEALEDALFTALNLDYSTATDLDLFSFGQAHGLFQAALDVNPNNNTAALGLAATSLFMLEDDPQIRAYIDAWEAWGDATGLELTLENLVQVVSPLPPTLAELQTLLREVLEPAVSAALEAIEIIDSADFEFRITARMQGETPANAEDVFFDLTDATAVRGFMEAFLAGASVARAYQTNPSPWGPTGFDAALAPGSNFGMLAADGGALMAAALPRLIEAVDLLEDAVDLLVAETDTQSDDVVKYDPTKPWSGYDNFDQFLGPVDIQDIRDALSYAAGVLAGPFTITEDFGRGVVSLVIDATPAFTNPPNDLKTLLPDYETMNSEFMWTALAFDEWILPDPTVNSTLPGFPDTDSLKQTVDLTGIYDEGRQYIFEWRGITQSPADGDLYAINVLGELREVAGDLASDSDRPDLPNSQDWWVSWSILGNRNTGLLVANVNEQLYTRPDDAATAWELRHDPPICCTLEVYLAESPAGDGNVWALTGGGLLAEHTSDFLTEMDRPDVPNSVVAFTGNDQTGELVALSWDGTVYSRPADAATEWGVALDLGSDDWDRRWVGLTQSPTGGELFVINAAGDLTEIASDFSSVTARPSAAATNFATLTANRQTGELVAMTEDGRLFARPADAATGWTLRRTLPRTVVPQ